MLGAFIYFMSGSDLDISLLSFAGTSYYISSLVKALAENDEVSRVQVLVPVRSPEVETLPNENQGIEVVTLDIDSSLGSSLIDINRPSMVRNVCKWLEAFNPDIVHLVFEMRVPFYYAPLIRRLVDVPIVLTVHEPDPYLPTLFRRLFLNPLQTYNLKALVSTTDAYIVHCDELKTRLAPHVSDTMDVVSIPHGDFSYYFTQWADKEISTRKDILFFGRAAPGKGIPTLIEAGREILDTKPDATLTIAGSGYDSDRFGELSSERFTVIDRRLPEEDAAELFQRAAIVVMPYHDATASGIPSIAGGFETPVVATNVGCLPSLVGDERGGLIVDPEDPDALRDALVQLLADETIRHELGETLGEMHRSEFSWEYVAERTVALYGDVHRTSR